jgi:Tfp pilus assembly PilM family ATPase
MAMAKDSITGLALKYGSVQWTRLRKVRNRYAVAGSGTVPVAPGKDGPVDMFSVPPGDRPAVAAQIRQGIGTVEGRVAIAIPSGQALLRVVELPTKDRNEIDGMVNLQVDKFSPFPADSTVLSFEVLHETGSTASVLIACIHRKLVEGIGEIMTKARIFPGRVDLELLCKWRLVTDSGKESPEGRRITILRDEDACDLVVTNNGVPVMFRSLGRTADLTPETLCEEIDYTLTTLEADFDITDVDSIVLWHSGEEPVDLTAAIGARLAMPVETRSLDTLPPLAEGLALRSIDAGVAKLNLALPEWSLNRKQIQIRRNLLRASVAVLALWSACVGGLFAWDRLQARHLVNQKAHLAEVESMAEPVYGMRRMLLTTEQYTNRAHSALECLREVTVRMPSQSEVEFLRLFTYENAKGRVVVQGEGSDRNAILNFGNSLRESPLFVTVEVDGPREIQAGRYGFTVTMNLPK